MDLRGDSITVANDDVSRNDIASIVDKKNRDYITYDENGNMSLNFGNMSQKEINRVLKDKGLNLLNNLINATNSDGTSQKFFYATTNERKGIDSRTGEAFNITLTYDAGSVLTRDNSFASNLPATGGTVLFLPETGYDGTVRISQGTMYNSIQGFEFVVPRKELIHHELSESYLKVNKGMNYQDAHNKAGGSGVYTKFIWGK